MAKKTLLSEGRIRKFMKLAAIGPLAENFLAEEEEIVTEEEELVTEEEVLDAEEEVLDAEMPPDMDMDADDMGGEEPDAEEAIKAALEQLIDAIKAAPEMDIAVDGSEDDSMEASMDDDLPMEDDPMEDDPMEEALYEALNKSVRVVDTQAVVKEVSRRVAKRLIKESKREKLAEALATRIAAKLG
tara:strand:- start:262 stop:819 length:558 start_codon:yes stop_codon:yes gene_type:complete